MTGRPEDLQAPLIDDLNDEAFLDVLGPTDAERQRSRTRLSRAEYERSVTAIAGNGTPGSGLPEPVCLFDVVDDLPPPKEIATGFLPEAEPIVFAGKGGSYKTTAGLAVACAIAGGYPVFGVFPVAGPQPVLIVSEEDSLNVIWNHVRALIAGMEYDEAQVRANLHVIALGGARFNDLAWREHIASRAERLGAGLLIFDPLTDLLGGSDVNPDSEVIQFWRRLVANGHTVLILHHYGKPKEGYDSLDRVRGWSGWTAAARAVYVFEERAGAGAAIACEKYSRTQKSQPFEITITIEADPDLRTSWRSARVEAVGLVAPGDWKMIDQRRLTPSEHKALAALDRHREEGISWSKWVEVSGVASSTLSEAIPRLMALGYVDKTKTGERAGKAIFSYSIAGPGTAVLIPEEPSTPRLRPDSVSTPPESVDSRLRDSAPILSEYGKEAPGSQWQDGVDSGSGGPGQEVDVPPPEEG